MAGGARTFAQARGVVQQDIPAFCLPVDRDGVAGDARFRSGQCTVFAEQAVEQARFADIGPAGDGETKRFVYFGFFRWRCFIRVGLQGRAKLIEAEPVFGG